MHVCLSRGTRGEGSSGIYYALQGHTVWHTLSTIVTERLNHDITQPPPTPLPCNNVRITMQDQKGTTQQCGNQTQKIKTELLLTVSDLRTNFPVPFPNQIQFFRFTCIFAEKHPRGRLSPLVRIGTPPNKKSWIRPCRLWWNGTTIVFKYYLLRTIKCIGGSKGHHFYYSYKT